MRADRTSRAGKRLLIPIQNEKEQAVCAKRCPQGALAVCYGGDFALLRTLRIDLKACGFPKRANFGFLIEAGAFGLEIPWFELLGSRGQ